MILALSLSAIIYAALALAFIGERTYDDGRKERVVMGYSLRPELEKAVKEASAEATAIRTPEEIRQNLIDAVVANTDNPSAPYSRSSRAVVAIVLLASWEVAFAALAGLIVLRNRPTWGSRN
jgi:hypothetical protein